MFNFVHEEPGAQRGEIICPNFHRLSLNPLNQDFFFTSKVSALQEASWEGFFKEGMDGMCDGWGAPG